MALTKKLATGFTAAAMLLSGFIVTACDKEVSGTFSVTETTPEVTTESTAGTSAETTADPGNSDNDNNSMTSQDKATLFNQYDALSYEQMTMLDMLCESWIGGDDSITWGNEKDFYDSLSTESKMLAGFKDIRYDETSGYEVTQIDITDITDQDLQEALAPFVENGYTITSTVGEDSFTYNGERLVGNIFFNTGYHIDSYSENLVNTGFVVKATDELFQSYMYALSKRAVLESSMNYDYTVQMKDNVYQVEITRTGMCNIEIEYDTSTGIMAYIIKIDYSDTVG